MLKVKNLSYKLQRNIFSDISFEIPDGGCFVMLGHSGSGKTSIANAILGILPKSNLDGEIFFSQEIEKGKIGFVPQDAHSTLNPLYKIKHQLRSLAELKKINESDFRDRRDSLISLLGLNAEALEKYPYQLSGGMKQKILIAMAAFDQPKLIIADEPTASIDAIFKKEILDLLIRIKNNYQSSIFLITHDFSIAEHYADYVGILSEGKLVEAGTRDEVLSHSKNPITRQLAMNRITKKDFGVKIEL